jgi:uncharacterized protein (TIGR03067 family)
MVRFALCVSLLAFAATTSSADDAADLKALVGTWKIEKAELGGKDVLEHVKTLDFRIEAGGKYTAKIGTETDNGSFTVDSAKTPKRMDITSTGGPNKGKTIPALYKLDGDTLTVCYQMRGTDRPTAFESKPDTDLFLAVYKREKK